jgi:hypothetical protein
VKYLYLALAFLSVCPATVLAQASGPPHVEHETDYIQSIIKYVRNTRGWPDSSYTIEFYGKDGDDLIFSVGYDRSDNATNFVGNEGDSFKVLFNPKSNKVERELYFG